nr:uncharacterized protein LOC110370510 isoform X2 [Helicoverpa armigera]
MDNKWIGLIYFIILRQSIAFDEENMNESLKETSQVEVRAVFINCEPVQEVSVAPDSDSMRFEREELFKHSVLRDCYKKLAVTVKIVSEPEQNSGDEYLPIEHVFEGSNKKRIRLLDPYILRLRREQPLQAYKLRRVDTISGILLDSEGTTFTGNIKHVKSRIERDIGHSGKMARGPNVEIEQTEQTRTIPLTPESIQPLQPTTLSFTEFASQGSRSCANSLNEICTNQMNTTLSKRKKRSEHNIVVEEASDDNKQWKSKERYYQISEPERDSGDIFEERPIDDDIHHRLAFGNHKKESAGMAVTEPLPDESDHHKKMRTRTLNTDSKAGRNKNSENLRTNSPSIKTKDIKTSMADKRFDDRYGEVEDYNNNVEREEAERDYAVYEIGHPELWYTVHVQLFEKLSTPDGKTVWNDLTKGEQASVSSLSPEWIGQDLTVRYRPGEWIPREEFSLPTSNLCLLAPIRGSDSVPYNVENGNITSGISEDGGYVVLPQEDVMGLKDDDNIFKRNDNGSDSDDNPKPEELSERNEQGHRRVVVRTSRALLSGSEEKVNIAFQGSDKYLTLPHRRPHHAQIDLEARADENELVRIGASGRIAIAVADSTRRTRTIITLQVGNTGLAAARFRVITRDCGPALSDFVNEKNKQLTMAGPVLIPPRHTRTVRLELPVEIPIDIAHCSVSLVNDEEKSIAVREVAIKKGDRCFCVWHCDCVCLTEDPRLLCREMPEARQSAAGLSSRGRTRHARSCCYRDVVSLNVFVVFAGVIVTLLFFGCLKAFLGLIFSCIGSWGLCHIVQVPRKLDHYYEASLKCRPVEYDCEGYAVHPDTKERTVRMFSRTMEFILNVIFFVTVPCIIVAESIKGLISHFRSKKTDNGGRMSCQSNSKKCFSTQDMQMRPLLRDIRHEPSLLTETRCPDSCADSEQDDTDYVLTQMQKSRESLSVRFFMQTLMLPCHVHNCATLSSSFHRHFFIHFLSGSFRINTYTKSLFDPSLSLNKVVPRSVLLNIF